MQSTAWLNVVSLLISLALLCVGVWWLWQYDEHLLLEITAPSSIETTLPVYAQFIVTQKITLPSLASIRRISLPLFLQAGTELQINLLKNGELVQRWRYQAPSSFSAMELVEAELPLEPPQLLEGEVELQFSAQNITHEEQDNAPRLLVETAGDVYPGGNYRIADNEKNGDVALRMYERRQHLEELTALWWSEPIGTSTRLLVWVLVGVLMMSLPQVVWRAVVPSQG